jgi:hypothetical protein
MLARRSRRPASSSRSRFAPRHRTVSWSRAASLRLCTHLLARRAARSPEARLKCSEDWDGAGRHRHARSIAPGARSPRMMNRGGGDRVRGGELPGQRGRAIKSGVRATGARGAGYQIRRASYQRRGAGFRIRRASCWCRGGGVSNPECQRLVQRGRGCHERPATFSDRAILMIGLELRPECTLPFLDRVARIPDRGPPIR